MREFLFGGEHLPAWYFFLRAFILYFTLVMVTRWMGHRQVGIISGHNYLIAAGIVSLAGMRMVNSHSSLAAGLAIIVIYGSISVTLSKLDLRWPLRIDRQPITLINEGRLLSENLRKARITLNELLALMRLGGCPLLSEAWIAVFEPTGKLSVIKKANASPVTRKTLGLTPVLVGSSTVLIREGQIDKTGITKAQWDESWLKYVLDQQYRITDVKQIYLAAVEPDNSLFVVLKNGNEG